MKITVIAGTPMDTASGVQLLLDHNIHVERSISISKNSEQQTLFLNNC